MSLRIAMDLGRWLGPWTDGDRVPGGVVRGEVAVGAGPASGAMRAATWLPASGEVRGALFVVPGLHPQGPDDPRFARFLAVLAASGIAAFSPYLPAFLRVRLEPSLLADVERAFAAFEAWPARPRGRRPGVMSISFGSRLALHLAGVHAPDRVGGLVLFGGYSDWREAMAFALGDSADSAPSRDPLNTPAVFLNLVEGLDVPARDRGAAVDAWRRYIDATWGRPEMKLSAAHAAVAAELAATLTPEAADLFLSGCGLRPDTATVARAALARLDDRAWLDPRPALAGVRAPLAIVHGADDDVIPIAHARALHRLAPATSRAKLLLTGLYGHTAHAAPALGLRRAPALARELRTMVGILGALSRAAAP
ncbi:MAG: alpha/beta hydrolase [Myxococcota bacterium]